MGEVYPITLSLSLAGLILTPVCSRSYLCSAPLFDLLIEIDNAHLPTLNRLNSVSERFREQTGGKSIRRIT